MVKTQNLHLKPLPLLHRPLDLHSNQDVYEYFRQGLKPRIQCDLYTGLAKVGILPG
ncbi:hypothetical protein BGX30_001799, partial [Mortierella sp. GBA39]